MRILLVDELDELGYRSVVSRVTGVLIDYRERWFFARVPPFEINTSGFTDEEHTSILAHRWWTLDELRRASERLVPSHLAELLSTLLRHGLPETPIDIAQARLP